jgi:kinesin family protein 1
MSEVSFRGLVFTKADDQCLIYQLKPGITIAGATTGQAAHVRLSGSHILDTHCIFTNTDGKVTVEALADARTFVNGKRVPPNSPIKLLNGYRVILGDFHVFRYNDPQAVRLERQRLSGTPRSDSPSKLNDEFMDWTAARREVADIEKLGDQDLDKLYDDIVS